jgi:hypothetical protein
MQFAIVLALCVSGLLTLQWSFMFGGLLVAAGVLLHAKIDRSAEEVFFAVLFYVAAIGSVGFVVGDIWQRLFN